LTRESYIFAGGGSGGHLFPGIAVAQALQERQPDAQVLFVGSDRDVERRILEQEGFEHRPLPTAAFTVLRQSPRRFAWRNWQAWRAALRLVRDLSPRAVIGCGGFASAPVVLAASRQGVPVVLLEQNVVPGRATRWLARRASSVCVSFAECAARVPHSAHCIVTGNPVRAEIAELTHGRRPGRPHGPRHGPSTLLVLGGSQGAQALNSGVTALARTERAALADWRIVHQTGERDAQAVRAAYVDLALDADVQPFFPDIVRRYASADLVISRAGATTLAELACAELPVLLVPYPHAAQDHQRANAELFVRAGAAVMVTQANAPEATAALLATTLLPLLNDPRRRAAMSQAMHSLARPAAAGAVLAEITAAVDPSRGFHQNHGRRRSLAARTQR
jgi:UDP-N-acetylglucosamine--N-acetylmuramyl-(pentapeptide) pyrophosphoryl-undecaprenol N-acetylglucosamine transferase